MEVVGVMPAQGAEVGLGPDPGGDGVGVAAALVLTQVLQLGDGGRHVRVKVIGLLGFLLHVGLETPKCERLVSIYKILSK